MSLVMVREKMRQAIADGAQGLAQVDTHGGRFDADELKRWALKSPAVVVGALSVPEVMLEGGQRVAKVEWGAFILVQDTPKLKRSEGALVMLEAVIAVIHPGQRWDDADTKAPEQIKASNLYNGKGLDAKGVALWAVTWQQCHDINAFDMATLDDFLTYRSTTQLSDDEDVPTAQDAVDLPAWEAP